jgi:Domain of unknown function (DUF4304)
MRQDRRMARTRAGDIYRCMLRDVVGPAIRAAGFKGSAPTWTFASPSGDLAIVNAQASSFSSARETRFVINLAVVPEPWWSYRQSLFTRRRPRASPADGLWWDRLHPFSGPYRPGPERWWLVTDETSAAAAGADVVNQLQIDAVPLLKRLVDREQMLASVRRGDFGFLQSDPRGPLAVLLAAAGPSDELAALLSELSSDDEPMRARYHPLVEWCRARAGST